ncbi:hypothetical protein PPACK8108_LOCUS21832 [Phakopsora pachyrhizi]|uniref:Uncharacterized protein n=1 Tax=Phakopsora pachyrhizi TaxID=170000 RepID=A0AAV0BKB3_PHAPC|nr:hypothetical protein PPACK8108_LOCUS21832 [Phakopsora pachyrhizi]
MALKSGLIQAFSDRMMSGLWVGTELQADPDQEPGRRDGLAGLPVPDLKNSNLRRLIVVPGHAIYLGGVSMIRTRKTSNQTISEAASYLRLSHQLGLLTGLGLNPGRITTEEFATNSLTNGNQTGYFINLGLRELMIVVVGRHGVEQEEKSFREAVEGERKVYVDFERDLYGCKTALRRKSLNRNPFRRYTPYIDSCLELTGIDGGILLRGGGDDAAYAWTF